MTNENMAEMVKYGIALSELRTPEFTQKVLVVSTAHIPERTGTALLYYMDCAHPNNTDTRLLNILSVDQLEFGHLVHITDDKALLEEEVAQCGAAGHPELGKLIALAAANGFDLLRLDDDGATLPDILGFATFDW